MRNTHTPIQLPPALTYLISASFIGPATSSQYTLIKNKNDCEIYKTTAEFFFLKYKGTIIK